MLQKDLLSTAFGEEEQGVEKNAKGTSRYILWKNFVVTRPLLSGTTFSDVMWLDNKKKKKRILQQRCNLWVLNCLHKNKADDFTVWQTVHGKK